MGVVADFVRLPEGAWPAAMSHIQAADVEVRDEGVVCGVAWYGCSRGACRLGLAYSPGDREVMVYCPARRVWRRPLGMWRLLRDVRRAVQAAADAEPGAAADRPGG